MAEHIQLHELPQRRLEATVSLVESGLDRMERLLAEGGEDGIVRAVENGLAPDLQASLLAEIRQLRRELESFAQQFSLQRRPVDIRQVLNAELSSAWVMLENCRPERMKGFGVEFDSVTRDALDESVGNLVMRVLTIRAKLR